jgi:hypothetical protein
LSKHGWGWWLVDLPSNGWSRRLRSRQVIVVHKLRGRHSHGIFQSVQRSNPSAWNRMDILKYLEMAMLGIVWDSWVFHISGCHLQVLIILHQLEVPTSPVTFHVVIRGLPLLTRWKTVICWKTARHLACEFEPKKGRVKPLQEPQGSLCWKLWRISIPSEPFMWKLSTPQTQWFAGGTKTP